MSFILGLIIFVLAWPLISRSLMRLLQWWVGRKFRKAMGFGKDSFNTSGSRRNKRNTQADERKRGPGSKTTSAIPKEYAVDVEFVEIREFAQTEVAQDRDGNRYTSTKVEVEKQVVDVEWEEIK